MAMPSYLNVPLIEEAQTELQWCKQALRTPAPFVFEGLKELAYTGADLIIFKNIFEKLSHRF